MKPTVLDDRIADRLVSGALTPDTTPAGYERVVELLGMARPAPAAMADAGREAATVAAMRAAIWHTPVPTPIGASTKRGFARLATPRIAAAAAALVVFGASAAAAATGSLPGPAQNAASTVLSKVGISVPAHHGQSDNNGNHGTGNNGSGGEDGSNAATPGSHGHGTPAGETGTTATTRLTGNDDFGLCNAVANNDGHSNASVFPSASTCTSVTHPGNADNSNGKSDEHKPTTTTTAADSPTTEPGHKGSPPTSTPADTRVTQPNKPTTTTTSTSTTVTTAGKGNGNGNGNANGSDNGNGPTANSGNANGPGGNSPKS